MNALYDFGKVFFPNKPSIYVNVIYYTCLGDEFRFGAVVKIGLAWTSFVCRDMLYLHIQYIDAQHTPR